MSRINNLGAHQTKLDHHWLKKNHDQITSHPAWVGNMAEIEANRLLEGKSSFTYVLRQSGKEHTYYISFVREDQTIKHQYFTLERDRKGWYYKNGVTTGSLAEIISEKIEDLIPQMMHCNPQDCKILTYLHA